jgi:hypothetical protein
MTIRKFLTSVADVYAYDSSDNILFTGKTLLDSSIEVSLGSAPVRGGRGNQLQYIYYHTGEMAFNLTDTQWNLQMLGATVGADLTTSNNVYFEENITLSDENIGTVTQTPLAFSGTAIYGWVTDTEGNTARATMQSDKTFLIDTGTFASGSVVCVRYYTLNAASESITVNANMIPKVVRLVMETQLNSSDASTNKIGLVQIIAPSVVLSGAFSISMTSDGVANTPLTGTALAYNGAAGTDACADKPYYARIIEIIDAANWYDKVIAFAIEGGDFAMLTTDADLVLPVWAIPSSGAPFRPPYADLEFTSGTVGTATIGAATGVVSPVGAGDTLLTVKGGSGLPASVIAIEASATLTVSTP